MQLNNIQQQISMQIVESYNSFCKNRGIFRAVFQNKHKKGFYIYGISGSGKTTLTNATFLQLSDAVRGVNMHFNDYFLDISRLLQKYNYKTLSQKIASKIDVLFFDEFFVESIADAKILSDLFSQLYRQGVFVVLTSNFAPEKLFEGGFNRNVVFPKFSDDIYANLEVIRINTTHDYRLDMRGTNQIIVFTPSQNAAIFDYSALLSAPVGVKKFIEIARNYEKICISNCPAPFGNVFSSKNEDEAIRFRDLIDTLYLRNCVIELQTELQADIANIDNLFAPQLLQKKEFIRTHSRLNEMASNSYAANPLRKQKHLWCEQARIFFENL